MHESVQCSNMLILNMPEIITAAKTKLGTQNTWRHLKFSNFFLVFKIWKVFPVCFKKNFICCNYNFPSKIYIKSCLNYNILTTCKVNGSTKNAKKTFRHYWLHQFTLYRMYIIFLKTITLIITQKKGEERNWTRKWKDVKHPFLKQKFERKNWQRESGRVPFTMRPKVLNLYFFKLQLTSS